MTTHETGPKWSGDMLINPAMVAAFTEQLRKVLNGQADFVAAMRRDAEAMWKANPPAGYNTFEAWWRHRWVTSPFAEIQAKVEEAAALTFELEKRYRKGRHEIPAARAAAALEKKRAATPAIGAPPGAPPRPEQAPGTPAAPAATSVNSFLDMLRKDSA